jgi:chromosome segregation ATPase
MEISGFKSFADKTIIYFELEITVIVESNDSGKSDIQSTALGVRTC